MRREIEFVKLSPTQNMTLLVKTKHAAEERRPIASRLMCYDHVYAEQVGFILEPHGKEAAYRLEMAGGEFCGNACMSLAVYLAVENGFPPEEAKDIVLEASGTALPVVCRVRTDGDKHNCSVAMPLPLAIEQQTVRYENDELHFAVVRYPGFVHLVIEAGQFDHALKKKAQDLTRLLGAATGVDLIGVLLYNADDCELAPLIYVPSLDSLIWERGCGSGTASLGAWLAWKTGKTVTTAVKQPGGTIQVTAEFAQGTVTGLRIEGTVGIVAHGKAFVEL